MRTTAERPFSPVPATLVGFLTFFVGRFLLAADNDLFDLLLFPPYFAPPATMGPGLCLHRSSCPTDCVTYHSPV